MDQEAVEIKDGADEFVVVVGYGNVGRIVCDLLDKKFIKFVGLEINPQKAIEARNRGLPVFFGDITRPEVAQAFNVGKAKTIILTIKKVSETNRAVIVLRRLFPELDIFARAGNSDHQKRLQNVLNVKAMVPVLPRDSALLSLPFGGAVLRSLGTPEEEINALVESKRKQVLEIEGLKESSVKEEEVQTGDLVEEEDEEELKLKKRAEEERKKEEEEEDFREEPFAGESREIGENAEPLTKKDVIEGVLFDFAKVGKETEESNVKEE